MHTATLRCGLGFAFALCAVGCSKAIVDEPGGMAGTAGVMATAGSGGFGALGGSGGFGALGGGGGFGAIDGGSGSGATGGSGGTGGNGLNCGDTYQRPVDVLFVIDNSNSMREEQQALRQQMPRMIQTLTSGVGSDGVRFVAVSDLHVGVVSTDMGLPGVPGRLAMGCGDESRPLGDDGVLRNAPNPGMAAGLVCAGMYPPFLNFVRDNDVTANDALVTQLSSDFACVASLGIAGCGFEQQLESALRGLWPSDNVLPNGQFGVFADGRPFIDGTVFGKGSPTGPNSGFLRNSISAPSLLAIVLVTDEEDCSSHNMGHFIPPNFLADTDPLKAVGLNLRCYNEAVRSGGDGPRDEGQANLYATTRYAEAFKALRPGNEHLVVLAAIVGVPVDLVSPSVVAGIDFSNQAARDNYYNNLLADARMQEQPDTSTTTGNPNLIPSCVRDVVDPVTGVTVVQKAFPPRRFIKVAREFGFNAVIQSICQDDFTPAVDTLLKRIGDVIRGECPLE